MDILAKLNEIKGKLEEEDAKVISQAVRELEVKRLYERQLRGENGIQ